MKKQISFYLLKQCFFALLLINTSVISTAQVVFNHATNSSNTSEHITRLNHPQLNNNPSAIVFVAPVFEAAGDQNPTHTFGVWYNGSNWTIFNQDLTPMEVSPDKRLRFNVLAFPGSNSNVFVHTVTPGNKSAHITTLDHPAINNNPNAMVTVTQFYGVYNAHEIGVWYDGGRWKIFNQDLTEMPVKAKFNVLIGTGGIAGASSFYHTHTNSSKLSAPNLGYTALDQGSINNRKEWMLLVTQRWVGTYNNHVYNIWYDDPNDPFKNYRDGRWLVFNSLNQEMPLNAAFNVLVLPKSIRPAASGYKIKLTIQSGSDDLRSYNSAFFTVNYTNGSSSNEFFVIKGLGQNQSYTAELLLDRQVTSGDIRSITLRHDGTPNNNPLNGGDIGHTYDNWDLIGLRASLLTNNGEENIFNSAQASTGGDRIPLRFTGDKRIAQFNKQ